MLLPLRSASPPKAKAQPNRLPINTFKQTGIAYTDVRMDNNDRELFLNANARNTKRSLRPFYVSGSKPGTAAWHPPPTAPNETGGALRSEHSPAGQPGRWPTRDRPPILTLSEQNQRRPPLPPNLQVPESNSNGMWIRNSTNSTAQSKSRQRDGYITQASPFRLIAWDPSPHPRFAPLIQPRRPFREPPFFFPFHRPIASETHYPTSS